MRRIVLWLLVFSLLALLPGCGRVPVETISPTAPPESEPPATEPPGTATPETEPPAPPTDPSLLFPPFEQPGVILLENGGRIRVTLLSAESNVSYRVRYSSGSEAVVGWDRVAPLAPDPPTLPTPTAEETVAFLKGEIGDPLPAWVFFVDLTRLTVTALQNGEVIRVMPCSVGDAAHPTPRGRFETDYKTEFMGKEGVYLCRWGVHYYGGYLLHSVLYTWRGDEILDGELSARISHGCVRLSPEDSRWIYETAPLGAVVLVN